MPAIKALKLAVIATFLAAGVAQAGAEAKHRAVQPTRTSVRTQSASAPLAQADVFYAAKTSKACTYRGGPKTGSWDCR